MNEREKKNCKIVHGGVCSLYCNKRVSVDAYIRRGEKILQNQRMAEGKNYV